VYALKTFKQYVLGQHFVLRTDHAALQWLRRTPEPLGQQARWLTFIEMFDFAVVHRAGTKHGNADGLSRRPCEQQDDSIAARGVVSTLSPEAEEFVPRGMTVDDSTVGDLIDLSVDMDTCKSENEVQSKQVSDVDDNAMGIGPVGEEMADLQLKDPDIGPILGWRLHQEERPAIEQLLSTSEASKMLWAQWDQLELHNGVLFRRKMGQGDKGDVLQLLVPACLRSEYVQRAHTGITGGHLGIRRTMDQVRRRAFWSGWRRDVRRHCHQCQNCNCYYRGQLPRSALLQPMVTGAPFERLHVDLTGPHPRSRRGSVFIVTCVDPFTKWTEAFPLPNKEAATVARVIVEQVICRLGMPIAILTDRGKEVDGHLMAEVCRLLDIDKQRTTAYKASTNAAIERFHRTLNSMMGRVVNEHQRDWDALLPYVMAAFRSSVHEATHYTPNYLMLGREVRAPVDIVYGSPPSTCPASYDDYASELEDRMRLAYTLVREHLKVAAERNKRYYDLRVRSQRYKEGDWVYYYNPRKFVGRQDKWRRKYSGPFLVTKVIGPVNVLLQRHKRQRPFCVHIDKIKPYVAEVMPKSWLEAEVVVPDSGDRQKTSKSKEAAAPEDSIWAEGEGCSDMTAIAGAPLGVQRTPRPKRIVGRPKRYLD